MNSYNKFDIHLINNFYIIDLYIKKTLINILQYYSK